MSREIQGRMKAPKTDGIRIHSSVRPIDYGHCLQIMQEKYGPVRGQHAYDGLIDNPGQGIQFVVATEILKQKAAMMKDLKIVGWQGDHQYQDLWDRWMAAKPWSKQKEMAI